MTNINSMVVVVVSKSKSSFKGSIVGLKCVEHFKEKKLTDGCVEYHAVLLGDSSTNEDVVREINQTLGHLRIKPSVGIVVRDEHSGVSEDSVAFMRLHDNISTVLEKHVCGDQYKFTYKVDRSLC